MKKAKQFFRLPYVYLVIGIIGAEVFNKIYGWVTFKEILGYIKTAITFKVNTPVLVLLILAILLVLLVIILFQKSNETDVKQPLRTLLDSLNYTQDTFGGIIYKWEWFITYDEKYNVTNITRFCPKDSCQLLYEPLSSRLECSICENIYFEKYTEPQIKVIIHKKIKDKYQEVLNGSQKSGSL